MQEASYQIWDNPPLLYSCDAPLPSRLELCSFLFENYLWFAFSAKLNAECIFSFLLFIFLFKCSLAAGSEVSQSNVTSEFSAGKSLISGTYTVMLL